MRTKTVFILASATALAIVANIGWAQLKTAPDAAEALQLAQQDELSPICETLYGYCYVDSLPIGTPCWCGEDEGYIVEE